MFSEPVLIGIAVVAIVVAFGGGGWLVNVAKGARKGRDS